MSSDAIYYMQQELTIMLQRPIVSYPQQNLVNLEAGPEDGTGKVEKVSYYAASQCTKGFSGGYGSFSGKEFGISPQYCHNLGVSPDGGYCSFDKSVICQEHISGDVLEGKVSLQFKSSGISVENLQRLVGHSSGDSSFGQILDKIHGWIQEKKHLNDALRITENVLERLLEKSIEEVQWMSADRNYLNSIARAYYYKGKLVMEMSERLSFFEKVMLCISYVLIF